MNITINIKAKEFFSDQGGSVFSDKKLEVQCLDWKRLSKQNKTEGVQQSAKFFK